MYKRQQLKRKVDYKNCHRDEYIDKNKLFKAIDTLITLGHPHYAGVDMLEFRNKLLGMKLQDELYSSNESISIDDEDGLNVEGSHETVSSGRVQGHPNVTSKLQDEFYSSDEDKDEDEDDSDAKYQKEDPVQKYKFDYVESSLSLIHI